MRIAGLVIVILSCIVVGQKELKEGYRTECKGIEVNGYVILDEKVKVGKQISYRPMIFPGDDEIHGAVLTIEDGLPQPAKVAESSDTGKVSQ